jgi:hypothetical protein
MKFVYEREKMIYIDLIANKEDFKFYFHNENNNFVMEVKYFFTKIFSKINIIDYEEKTIILITNLKSKTLNRLAKSMLQFNSKNVCLSKALKDNKLIENFLIEQEKNILDGRWLFSCIVDKVLNYIEEKENFSLCNQEISILTNEIDEKIASWIFNLAIKYKKVNLVTDEPKIFENIASKLFSEYGIDLNISYNERKSLKTSNIILNFNFSEQAIKKFLINRKSIIINFERDIKVDSKGFNGIVINFYKIHLPYLYFEQIEKFKNFQPEILYESFVYKNTNFNNIKGNIQNDNLKIHYLTGIRGRINDVEFEKMKKELEKIG